MPATAMTTRMRANFVEAFHEPPQAGDADIGDERAASPGEGQRARGFARDGQVGGAGGDDADAACAPARGRPPRTAVRETGSKSSGRARGSRAASNLPSVEAGEQQPPSARSACATIASICAARLAARRAPPRRRRCALRAPSRCRNSAIAAVPQEGRAAAIGAHAGEGAAVPRAQALRRRVSAIVACLRQRRRQARRRRRHA